MGKLEAFNEMLFLFCCYHLLLFANLVNKYETREQIGVSFMFMAGFLVLINMLFVFGASVKGIYQSCRRKYLKRKQLRLIKEKREQILAKKMSIKAKRRQKLEAEAQQAADRQ